MAGNFLQVSAATGNLRVKNNNLVVAGAGDPCCCAKCPLPSSIYVRINEDVVFCEDTCLRNTYGAGKFYGNLNGVVIHFNNATFGNLRNTYPDYPCFGGLSCYTNGTYRPAYPYTDPESRITSVYNYSSYDCSGTMTPTGVTFVMQVTLVSGCSSGSSLPYIRISSISIGTYNPEQFPIFGFTGGVGPDSILVDGGSYANSYTTCHVSEFSKTLAHSGTVSLSTVPFNLLP